MVNPDATDKQLIRMARLSGLLLGCGMIGVALLVPAAGGMIEVVLSIAAITGGPTLLPPLWALLSKKLTGKAAFIISAVCLVVNLICKIVVPLVTTLKLSRSQEMLLGVALPFIMLVIHEFILSAGKTSSEDYLQYRSFRKQQKEEKAEQSSEEVAAIRKQNLFGLRVIAFALAFTALLLYVLCILAATGKVLVAGIATAVLLAAVVPLIAIRRLNNEQKNILKRTHAIEKNNVASSR
jgi:hypothetical protein